MEEIKRLAEELEQLIILKDFQSEAFYFKLGALIKLIREYEETK